MTLALHERLLHPPVRLALDAEPDEAEVVHRFPLHPPAHLKQAAADAVSMLPASGGLPLAVWQRRKHDEGDALDQAIAVDRALEARRQAARQRLAKDVEFKEANVKRDEGGKFAEQAGSGSSHTDEPAAPEPAPAPKAPKAKPPSGSKRGDKAREAHSERVKQILIEGYGGPSVEPSQDTINKMLTDITEVAYDYMGVDKADVPFSLEKPYDFKVGETEYKTGGWFRPSENKIAICDTMHPTNVAQLAAHEIMHHKYHAVREAYHEEDKRLSKDERGGHQWVMHPDGRIREEFQDDYPAHTMFPSGFGGNTTDLRKDDGITDYSRDWWKAVEDNKANFESAVNETLAEMANLDFRGMLPRLTWFKQSKSYKPFYEAIHKVYPAVVAATKAAAKTAGEFPSSPAALQASMRDLGFSEFAIIGDKLIVGNGDNKNNFAATIDPSNNSWSGTWGPNRHKMSGTGVASLKDAFDKFKRGVDPA